MIEIILNSLLVISYSILTIKEKEKINRIAYLVCVIIWSMCLSINIL